MSFTDELERFRIEALGRIAHEMDIIHELTGCFREIEDTRSRAFDRLASVLTQPYPAYDPYGPADPGPPAHPLNGSQPPNLAGPWPEGPNQSGHFQYPHDQNPPQYGQGPPGYDYPPPAPPPGHYRNGHAGSAAYPPPLADVPMREVLHNAAANGSGTNGGGHRR